ncbi:ribbon-helix-helix protein, CopG family [Ectobacillus ponti]|uniref:Ribbon-helix-helix domain-containing protein n=1 Tax=Ectobacillus ponti TaxID=2961894 RepID=A0AA42BMT8_9BACI|nr:ribbon-helix-helix protein, CopG family [Ectobacillus ponti]MCP8966972.1 ribbon-helix-helix domain-containing protein [Ectobacillus ponti]
MKVGEIIDRLNKHESLSLLAKKVGLAPYVLSKRLRMLGYEYDKEKKRQVFVGEGEEPRERSILEEVKPRPAAVNYEELMYEELRAIRMLLEARPSAAKEQQEEGSKKRRSFSLPEDLLIRLDLAAKRQGLQKSRIVEQALREWLQRE